MQQLRRPLLVLVFAFTALACGGPPVALLTQPSPEPGVAVACMDALITGTLVRHPVSGFGIGSPDGTVTPVRWPAGWSTGFADGATTLRDGFGAAFAREGGPISIGGGMGPDNLWYACG